MSSTINASTSSGIVLNSDTSGVLQLQTASTTAVTIDASQNVGVGVTPSAWASYSGVLQMTGGALAGYTGGNYLELMQNTYFASGVYKYVNTGYASKYQQNTGTHQWYVAPSGTAGNTISFTQAMTLDASGNLGIGTSSPNAKLDILATTNTIRLGRSTSSYATIDSNSNAGSLSLNADAGNTAGGGSMTFNFAGTERMRIDSIGNLLVGTTSGTGAQLRVHTSGTSVSYMQNSAASPNGLQIYYSNATPPNSAGNEFLYFNDVSTLRMSVRSNGGISNYSANNVNLSDERTKTDIVNAGNYLEKICAIPVRTFKYKDQTDDLLNLGVIAQEVETVAPELVDVSGFGETPEDGIPLKAIYQTDLQYALMKCIQELSAQVTELKAEVQALKGA